MPRSQQSDSKSHTGSEPDRPNLLFVFPDQMRASALGCAGNPDIQTPHLDALARQGIRFTHACANCPLCTPSRGTMLTGRYPLSHRAADNSLPLPQAQRTFGEILSDAGWETGYIGKWHLDGIPSDRFTPQGPRRHGFRYWAVWNCAHDYFRGQLYLDAPEPLELPGYEPDAQTDLAIDFIQRHQDKPFALFLSWGPPHQPYEQVPETYRRIYEPGALTLPPNVERPNLRVIADYYAAVTALDWNVGRLLDALSQCDLERRTIVVFTSDHGDMLFSHGEQQKQKPWEESISVPLIVRYPGVVPGGCTSRVLFSSVDLLPSLLGLLGVSVDAGVEGTDLSAILRGASERGPSSALIGMPIPSREPPNAIGYGEWRGVRTHRYTYARGLADRWGVLYDNEADPYQIRNVFDEPPWRATQRELEDELQMWLHRTGDEFLPWPEHIRRLGLREVWNELEIFRHPTARVVQ